MFANRISLPIYSEGLWFYAMTKEVTAPAMGELNFSHNLLGCRLDNWIHLMRENPVSEKKQARFIGAVSAGLSLPALLEWLIFYYPIKRTKIEKDPLYIVGFWRSGTTFLQNLLSRDPQYGWFDPVKTITFNYCILLKGPCRRILKSGLKGARPMDNMEYELDLPMEEVFAQAMISDQAITHMLAFPDEGRGTKYIETAFIDEQDEKAQKNWRKAYDYILRKVTYLYKGKQLLLKSPENTCRIGELRRCYPHAKFINIYRNPYSVILSTINMFTKEMENFRLNRPASQQVIEDVSIDLFERIYKKALPELESIPECDRIDVKYEDFCLDPEGYVKEIYSHLGIDGFEEAKPYFDAYLETQKNYQKNKFSLDPALRDRINHRLGFYFDYYGYERITE